MKKKNIITIIKFLAFFITFYILFYANINSVIYPFAFGMFFALIWSNQKVWLVAPSYVLAGIASSFSVEMAINLACTVLVLIVPYFVHIKLKKPMRKWEFGLLALLSQFAYLFQYIYGGGNVIYALLTVVLGVLFMYSSMGFFEAILVRGFNYRLTNLEIIFGSFILLALSSGLMHFSFYGFDFIKLFAAFIILLSAYTTNITTTLIFSGVMGLGTIVATNTAIYFAPILLWSLAVSAFKVKNKFIPCVSLLITEACTMWYFSLYYSAGIVEFLPVVIASAIFILIPSKITESVHALFNSANDRLAMKNLVNRNRELIHKRLYDLSGIFNDMNYVFRSMLKERMTNDEIKEFLFDEIKSKQCSECPERNKCHRAMQEESKQVFNELIEIAFKRGRITLLDLPPFLTTRCTRVNSIVSSINNLTAQYKKYAGLVSSIDTSKLFVADQLSGISDIMKKLSDEVSSTVSFDTTKETRLIDELTYNNIICSDAIIYEKNPQVVSASLVVRSEDCERGKLPSIVSKICKSKMEVEEVLPSNRQGFKTVNLKTAPRFDSIAGFSTRTKATSKESGDTYSLMRLDDDRYMIAICDGMGSGELAEKTSSTAIGLVENFYKAGFDSDLVLSSINKLLSLNEDDVFSAVDIGVIDLKNGIADFIKMGAPISFIKNEEGTKIIESGALPLGIVQNIKPITVKEVLTSGDIIVLCSDGITDAFASDQLLCDFIHNIRSTNPQMVADEILSEALLNNNGTALDDMTVVCLRIYEK